MIYLYLYVYLYTNEAQFCWSMTTYNTRDDGWWSIMHVRGKINNYICRFFNRVHKNIVITYSSTWTTSTITCISIFVARLQHLEILDWLVLWVKVKRFMRLYDTGILTAKLGPMLAKNLLLWIGNFSRIALNMDGKPRFFLFLFSFFKEIFKWPWRLILFFQFAFYNINA